MERHPGRAISSQCSMNNCRVCERECVRYNGGVCFQCWIWIQYGEGPNPLVRDPRDASQKEYPRHSAGSRHPI